MMPATIRPMAKFMIQGPRAMAMQTLENLLPDCMDDSMRNVWRSQLDGWRCIVLGNTGGVRIWHWLGLLDGQEPIFWRLS